MDDTRLHALAELARYSILVALDLAHQPPPDSSAFAARGAAFVTLTQATRLRGCIGTLEAWRTLAEDVAANARAAALLDPRFPALTIAEVPHTLVEVSVLEPATPLAFADESELLHRLRPGYDGLTIRYREQRATFLPAVWRQIPDPARFVAELRRKAGIADHIAASELAVERYATRGSPRLSLASPATRHDSS